MASVKIVLAEDHQVVRQGLRALLEAEPGFQVVGESGDGLETVALVEKLKPDVVVLDMVLPGLHGLEVARQVAKRTPATRVVVLSMYADEAYVLRALRQGAAAYVLKECDASELVRAVREAAAGRRYLSPPYSERAIDSYAVRSESAPPDPYDCLTPREREVFQLTAEGRTQGEIASRLYISARTVETHRHNHMRKLNVKTHAELDRFAARRGIVPLDR
jgi:DNA-binding NarL/FixJ family response regulator